jgi:hypothetical protein
VTDVLLFVLALSLVFSALALVREVRSRRALERLLRFLLSRWRNHEPSVRNYSADHSDDERLR